MTIRIRFEPGGAEATATPPVRISAAAHAAGLGLHLPCGGKGKCGKCRVVVISGEVTQLTDQERLLLKEHELAAGVRLACQTDLLTDGVIEVPPETTVVGVKRLRADQLRPVEPRPNVRMESLRLPLPSLADQRSDWERLVTELEPAVGQVRPCISALRELPGVLRPAQFQVTATVVGDRLVDIRPASRTTKPIGVAIDIGTTTVVAYLVDLGTGALLATAAAFNEQGRHGADVISRIEYCGKEARAVSELRDLVLGSVNQVIGEAAALGGCAPQDIIEATVVGNTAMNHLFLGLDPTHLAQAPYVPVNSGALELQARDSGLNIHPNGSVFCLPVIAGFVGADTVGVVLATDMTRRSDPVMAVDIGTNGEVALWTGKRLLVASCAMGPAMEGAQIEFGMRATPGAIERVWADNGDIGVRTIGDLPARGICGSGLVDAVATLLDIGAIDTTGRFNHTEAGPSTGEMLARRLQGEGSERRFILSGLDSSNVVYLSQRDLRQVQLAKGALRAASDLLLSYAGLNANDLSELLLAGAFGNYIEPRSALRIGMLPDVPVERVRGVGNAAGAGAVLSLVSTEERARAVELAKLAEHVELSQKPEFQEAFMEAMMFP